MPRSQITVWRSSDGEKILLEFDHTSRTVQIPILAPALAELVQIKSAIDECLDLARHLASARPQEGGAR
jgi:hypothetical protein